MARFVLPFFSTKYKTNVTIHCLLRALSASVMLEDELQPQDEEVETLTHTDSWQAPEIKRKLNLDTLFSLCMIDPRNRLHLNFLLLTRPPLSQIIPVSIEQHRCYFIICVRKYSDSPRNTTRANGQRSYAQLMALGSVAPYSSSRMTRASS